MTFEWTASSLLNEGGFGFVTKWLVRMVSSIALAVSWHLYSTYLTRKRTPSSMAFAPRKLKDDWTPSSSSSNPTEPITSSSRTSATTITTDVAVNQSREKWLLSLQRHSDHDDGSVEQKDKNDSSRGNCTEEMEADANAEGGDLAKITKHDTAQDDTFIEQETNNKEALKVDKKNAKKSNSSSLQQQQQPRRMIATTDSHPGLESFHRWYDIEASLFRIYVNKKGAAPPFYPKSERGSVSVELEVTNQASGPINVFWVDYKGRESPRGLVAVGQTWCQTTWIGHPWTFRYKNTGEVLLYYVPHRIAPSIQEMLTVSDHDPHVGVNRFTITPPKPTSVYATSVDDNCGILDPVFPVTFSNPTEAFEWSLQHMTRMAYTGLPILQKYFTSILLYPDETKYRQIRIANRTFFREIWNTAARGVLLAAGFVEHGAYAELGSERTLPRTRIREVSLILHSLEQWEAKQDGSMRVVNQPQGSDGFGRANFGRTGMN